MTDDPDWVAAGLDELTGPADGPSVVPSGRLGAGLRRLGALVGPDVDGPALAAERARLSPGLRRRGRVSCGGGARLLVAADGRDVCVNLPRRDDIESVEAWLGVAAGDDPWAAVAAGLAAVDAGEAVGRGQLLGLPVAVAATPEEADADAQSVARDGVERVRAAGASRVAPGGRARVVDLSSLWAGPLCGRLLAEAGGCDVVKVETDVRPDGARYGPPAFFAALNGMKAHRTVAVDELVDVVADADVVVVSARPRALRQVGLDPFAAVERRPWQVWVAITGYGLTGPWADRVAFGDDAAVAAGLSSLAGGVFCADAFADPCAGVAAAAGALSLLRAGRGGLVDISLREAAACVRHP